MEERPMLAKPLGQPDASIALLSPGVGLFTGAARKGELLCQRQRAGTLLVLGRAHALIVPDGVEGRVCNEWPERVHEPVDYGRVLYELSPLRQTASAPAGAKEQSRKRSQGLFVLAPQTGRFYHRAKPSDPPFVQSGSHVKEGSALGLIEVMKTFSQVTYRAQDLRGEPLPPQARVVAHLVADGAEVAQGDPLIEIAPWGGA